MGSARSLVLPLALGASCFVMLRLAVAPLGDAIAGTITTLVAPRRVAPVPAPPVAESASELAAFGPPVALPRRVASRVPAPRRDARDAIEETKDAGAKPPSPGDAPKATILVPASVVARAMEKRDVGATNAIAPDGSPLGARLAGVSKYRTGLRDGDVVVSVAGTRTPTLEVLIAVGLKAASGRATRLSGRIVRGDSTYAVVIELPR